MAITIGIAGITGYCRDASKFPSSSLLSPPPSPSVQIQITQGSPFDPSTIRSFVTDCDVVVCCYLSYHPPSDSERLMVDGQKILIDACEAAHVPRYVAGDWALDYTKLEFGQLVPKDAMKRVKAYLDTKEKVKGVHILTGAFMEYAIGPYSNMLDLGTETPTFRYWGEGDEVMEGSTYDDAAAFTAKVVLDPDATGVLRFVSGRATIREIAASFEKVYGIKPHLERLGSLDDLYKHMHELRAENPAEISKYMPLFFYYFWINGQTLVGPQLDNSRYPDVKPVDWESYLARWPLEQLTAPVATVGSQL